MTISWTRNADGTGTTTHADVPAAPIPNPARVEVRESPRETAARLLADHRTACIHAKDDGPFDPRDDEPTDYEK
jgi:hypothetical protein